MLNKEVEAAQNGKKLGGEKNVQSELVGQALGASKAIPPMGAAPAVEKTVENTKKSLILDLDKDYEQMMVWSEGYKETKSKEVYAEIEKIRETNPVLADNLTKAFIIKVEHIEAGRRVVQNLFPGDKGAECGMFLHDDGRFQQLIDQHGFNDGKMHHGLYGVHALEQAVFQKKINPGLAYAIIAKCVQIHGRHHLDGFGLHLSDENGVKTEAERILNLTSKIDDSLNGYEAPKYLDDEKARDDKKFRADFIAKYEAENGTKCPDEVADVAMKAVSDLAMESFMKGKKFDKKFCLSYADYDLFACLLAIQHLINPEMREIQLQAMKSPCGKYKNSVEGYYDVFDNHLTPEDAKVAKARLDLAMAQGK